MKSIKLTALAAFLFCTALNAQNRHELSLYGGGGLSTLNYKATVGEQKFGFGGNAGINYHIFFNRHWGIGTGVEFVCYNAKFNSADLGTNYMTTDIDGNPFEFRSKVSNYKENQNAIMLQIPLMLQYQVGKKHQFYIAAGGKVGIPIYGKYKNSGNIKNSGYYEYEDYEYTEQEFMGFGTFNREAKGKLEFLKTAFFVSAELGAKWDLGKKITLYTGAYLDYGLNNIYLETKTVPAQQFVAYNTDVPTDFAVNSVLNSHYLQNINTVNTFTEKIIPISAGIKLRLSFGFGSTAKKAIVEQQVETSSADEEAAAQAKAAEKAEADRLVKEQEKTRIAAEKAKQEEARRQAEKMQAAKTGVKQPIDNYKLSQAELTDAQKQELDQKIAILQQYPDMEVFIYGHTCNIGGNAINEKVGLARAQKAKEYLISKGIAEKRIIGIASKRDTEPLVPNTSEENRKQNRRIEIVVQ